MRPRILIALGVIVLVIAASALALTLLGEGEDNIGEIVLASDVADGTNAPVDDLDSFPAGTTEVYAALLVRELDAGATFEFRWQGAADEEPLETQYSLPADIEEETWVYGLLRHDDGLPPGDYMVEVRHQGELVDSRAFRVADE